MSYELLVGVRTVLLLLFETQNLVSCLAQGVGQTLLLKGIFPGII